MDSQDSKTNNFAYQRSAGGVSAYLTNGGKVIKPVTNARTVVITRSAPGMAASPISLNASREVEIRRSYGLGTQPGAASKVMSSGVGSIKVGREKEKHDMRELNERFANYIEKVRFLEAQNKKLGGELNMLRDRWGKETEKIKEMYEVEMDQLRKLLDDAEKAKGELEVRMSGMEDDLTETQLQLNDAIEQHNKDVDNIDKLNQEIAGFDGEISLLRRRFTSLEDERKRDKNEISRLREEVKRLRTDLDKETLHHIQVENEAQTLKDELEFLKQVHESELRELAALAYRDTTQENREYWKNEMAQALRDVQAEYDDKMDSLRSEMESYYNVKIQEVRTTNTRGAMELGNIKDENQRIRTQMQELRSRVPTLEARNVQLERLLEELKRDIDEKEREFEKERSGLNKELQENENELETVLAEMQHLMDAKLSLELEIAAYRKLLEGEETRVTRIANDTTTGPAAAAAATTTTTKAVAPSNDEQGGLAKANSQEAVASAAGGDGGGVIGMNATSTPGNAADNKGGETPTKEVNSNVIENNLKNNLIGKTEVSAKTTFQRTTKGSVSLTDCPPDGKYITLENTGKKREDVSGMKITRNIDSGRQIVSYTIPDKTFLEAEGSGKTLKIWALGKRPAGSSDLELNEPSWGMGGNVITTLNNVEGEEKATNIQKTVFNQ